MTRPSPCRAVLLAGAALTTATLMLEVSSTTASAAVTAAPTVAAPAPAAPLTLRLTGPDTVEPDPQQLAALPLLDRPDPPPTAASRSADAAADTPVGTGRRWYTFDLARGGFALSPFTLRASGTRSEIWVADDISFPAGDCRNPRTQITDAQATYLANELDTRILPVESEVFSTAPDRDGSNALNDPTGQVWAGAGDKVVALVDNIRDEAYYDTDNARNLPYVAGFFSRHA